MRRFNYFLGFLLTFSLLCSPVWAKSDWSIKNAIDVFLTAVTSQSPDPGLGTALAGAQAIKPGLIIRCNKKMEVINLELGENPPRKRVEELYEEMERVQAVQKALAGDPGPLNNWTKNEKERDKRKEKRKKDYEKKMRENEKKEDLDNMDDVISRIRKRVENVKKHSQKDLKVDIKFEHESQTLQKNTDTTIEKIKIQYFTRIHFINKYKTHNPCSTGKEIQKKVKALSVLTLENEKKYNQKIRLAKEKLKNCKDNTDTVFIKFNFDEAKKIVAQMEKDVAEIFGLKGQADKLIKDYNTLKDEFNKKAAEFGISEVNNLTRALSRLGTINSEREKIKVRLKKDYLPKMGEIKKDAIQGRNDYLPRYPKSKGNWDSLFHLINSITNELESDFDDGLAKIKMNRMREAIDDIKNKFKNSRKFKFADCLKDKQVKPITDKADAAKNTVLLDLVGNSNIPDLADDCSKKKSQPPQPVPPPQKVKTPQKPPAQTPGPTKPALPPSPTVTMPPPISPPAPHSGGLFISGKKELTSGEGVTFTAQDGAGKTYISGVTWNVSVEDVFVIGTNGTGVAFKAGACTIIAHKDDMAAYYDITVLAKVPNLIGKDLKQAVNELKKLGLTGLPVKVSTKKAMRITGQSVAPGSPARADTTIVLEVEEGKGQDQHVNGDQIDKGQENKSDESSNQKSDTSTDDSGFSDEGTSYGSDIQETEIRTENASADTEAADDFSDEGTQITSTPQTEQVTYFDRDWLPRTWKNTGDSKLTRYHIYKTATRLAMAAAFAKHLDARVDEKIAEYIRQAIEHMKKANQYSFAPHKAWPSWKEKGFQFNDLADRITKRSMTHRNYLRKGLSNKLDGEANAMAQQLETLSRGGSGSIENCDSLYFRIGYHLAYSAQLRLISNDAEKAGLPKKWIRQVNSKAYSNATTASRYIARTKPSSARAGCIDMKSLTASLRKATNFSNDHSGSGLYNVWSKGNEMIQQESSECSGKLAGTWIMANSQKWVVRYEKKGSTYYGRYLKVADYLKGRIYVEGKVYEELQLIDERTYRGFRIEKNYYNKWINNPLIIKVLGNYMIDSYGKNPDMPTSGFGGHGHSFSRIPERLIPTITHKRDVLYLKGYILEKDHAIPPDCLTGQKASAGGVELKMAQ